MTEPFPQDPVIRKVDSIVQFVLYDVAVTAACAYIKAQVPFLGLPIIGTITNFVVNQVAGILYKYLEQFLAFSIIDFRTKEEAQAYLTSVQALQKAQQSGDQNAIDESIKEFRANLQRLIQFGGT